MLDVAIKKDLGGFCLDVAFSTEQGVLALLGASGCGKSMTLRCIAGIETPDEGHIIIDGVTVYDSKQHIDLPPQKRQVGLLFQNYALFPNMTVEENILCGLREKKSKEEQKQLVEEYLRKFHLTGLEKHLPGQLSGGQKQRCALARMLIGSPKLLMLDEPFSALDSYLRWELERELLATLREYTGSVLFVSHDRDEVYRISDQIAVYKQGKIDVMGEKWDLFREPKTCTAAVLTGCKNVAQAEYGKDTVCVPAWGLSLPAQPQGPQVQYLGVRARKLRPGTALGPRTFRYELLEEIDGAFSDILMISLEPGKEPLRWEVTKETHEAMKHGPQLVEFPEDAVLYLTE
jgi:molybdate transport system ATP-binding protein